MEKLLEWPLLTPAYLVVTPVGELPLVTSVPLIRIPERLRDRIKILEELFIQHLHLLGKI